VNGRFYSLLGMAQFLDDILPFAEWDRMWRWVRMYFVAKSPPVLASECSGRVLCADCRGWCLLVIWAMSCFLIDGQFAGFTFLALYCSCFRCWYDDYLVPSSSSPT
jgi:hypothetical protein